MSVSRLRGRVPRRVSRPPRKRRGLLPRSRMFDLDESRFREGAGKTVRKNAPIYMGSTRPCEEEVVDATGTALCFGKPEDLGGNAYIIGLRLGVDRASKLRACGDLQNRLADSACANMSLAHLVSRDRLSQISRCFSREPLGWALFIADHASAYNRIHLDLRDMAKAVIVLWRRNTGVWNVCLSRTLMFGAVSGGLHYNVFSSLITERRTQLFGIPPSVSMMISTPWRPCYWLPGPQLSLPAFAPPLAWPETHGSLKLAQRLPSWVYLACSRQRETNVTCACRAREASGGSGRRYSATILRAVRLIIREWGIRLGGFSYPVNACLGSCRAHS